MTALLNAIDRVCFAAAVLAAFLLAALFVLGLSEIVLRSVFNISLPFVIEYSGYLLAFVLFLGSGWTLTQGGHIRVTLLSEHVNKRMSRRLDLFCTGAALIISSTMTFAFLDFAFGTLIRGTVSFYPSATPLAYPQLVFASGPLVLTLAFIARLIRLLRGDQVEADFTELGDGV